ncbi:hypothetical protein EUGRSUZ_L01663 [Eucalyptus grandis]|uniref:Uncharacterized protein n=1 Tax=Eucalyptus grandis TaxID=71139 RepID=A0A058ZTT5_EUCGR|nr:hypothetical protein EUGRSUZ_L01663 [Eucalyptus grandis]
MQRGGARLLESHGLHESYETKIWSRRGATNVQRWHVISRGSASRWGNSSFVVRTARPEKQRRRVARPRQQRDRPVQGACGDRFGCLAVELQRQSWPEWTEVSRRNGTWG